MDCYNDDELMYLMHCGSIEACESLYEKYYKLVARWVRPFSYVYQGMEFDDYVQIAMMNFQSIIDCYRDDQNASLKTYMKISLMRRFSSVLRPKTERMIYKEHTIVSLDDFIGKDKQMKLEEIVEDPKQSFQPDVVLVVKEKEAYYSSYLNEKASPRELEVMKCKNYGYNEDEISVRLNISVKSVYNAVYRYHKKVQGIDELE